MTAISATMVKQLRDQTGAGMMDCKKALQTTDGDIESAVDWLRKNGIAKAAGKVGRVTSEGVIAVAVRRNVGVAVEINCETDFVARNEQFVSATKAIAEVALNHKGNKEATIAASYPEASETVGEYLGVLTSTLGENLSYARSIGIGTENGLVSSYVHNAVTDGVGQIGVLVAITSTASEREEVVTLARQIAMHVAAAAPAATTIADLDDNIVEREKSILRDQALQSGKPESIVEKMLEGRMRKFYAESVLTEQQFVIDDSMTVAQALSNCAKQVGADISISGFVRWVTGESH